MKFFTSLAKLSLKQLHNPMPGGKEVIEEARNYILQKKYREALTLLDQAELNHPEYFKAISIFRGKASVGLLQELDGIEERSKIENPFKGMSK